MMKIASAVLVAVAITALPAAARTTSEANIPIPSAQNSGAGILGLPGTEDGSAVRPGTTGFGPTTNQHGVFIREQDAANVPGLPGTEDGPSLKPSALSGGSHRS
jgi:hypothetical protein